LLDNRLLQHRYSHGIPVKVVNATRNVRRKLLLDLASVYFGEYENAVATGCINEQIDGFYADLKVDKAFDLLNLDSEQAYLTRMIDMGKDMLYQLGYDRNTSFPKYNYQVRYRDTLAAINKMKQAPEICISRTGGDVYKIGFVTAQLEIFTWKMKDEPGVHDLSLFARTPDQARAIKKGFELVTDRCQAAILLNRMEETSGGSLGFFKAILN